jgi:hypothetical protein
VLPLPGCLASAAIRHDYFADRIPLPVTLEGDSAPHDGVKVVDGYFPRGVRLYSQCDTKSLLRG